MTNSWQLIESDNEFESGKVLFGIKDNDGYIQSITVAEWGNMVWEDEKGDIEHEEMCWISCIETEKIDMGEVTHWRPYDPVHCFDVSQL